MFFPLFVGVLCLSLFCYTLLCVHSNFAIILKGKRKLVALLLLSNRCIVTINVLWLFLAVLWLGLQCVIVVFPGHTHFLCHMAISYIPDLSSTLSGSVFILLYSSLISIMFLLDCCDRHNSR